MIKMWTDATPKFAGFVVDQNELNIHRSESIALVEGVTVNESEWLALNYGLSYLLSEMDIVNNEVDIFMDSELVVNQINGRYRTHKSSLAQYKKMACEKILRLKSSNNVVKVQWISGKTNPADVISRPKKGKKNGKTKAQRTSGHS